MKTAKSAKAVAPVARASGGKAEPQAVSGNKNVLSEAEDDDTSGRKKGGAVKRKKGGGVGRKLVSFYTGGTVKPRADRPGRKSGGGVGVGANTSPLSTAHSTISTTTGSSTPTDTYGGTPK